MRNKTIFLSSLALAIMMMIKPSAFCQDIKLLQQRQPTLKGSLKNRKRSTRYSRIAEMNPKDLPALVKCTELNCSIGNRTPDKTRKKILPGSWRLCSKAYIVDSASADANCRHGAGCRENMTEVEEEKKIVEFVNLSKIYDDDRHSPLIPIMRKRTT